MTLSGWCVSHGRPDQFHAECERRGVACACPNHGSEASEIREIGYDGITNKDGPGPAVDAAGSPQGLADLVRRSTDA